MLLIFGTEKHTQQPEKIHGKQVEVGEKGVAGYGDVFDVMLTNKSHALSFSHQLSPAFEASLLIIFYSRPGCPSKRVDRHMSIVTPERSFVLDSFLAREPL